jgi:hypothetical protein
LNEMERRLHHLPNQPVTSAEMGPTLIRIWNNIPQAFFNNLVRSMCRLAKHALMQMVDTHATDFVNV